MLFTPVALADGPGTGGGGNEVGGKSIPQYLYRFDEMEGAKEFQTLVAQMKMEVPDFGVELEKASQDTKFYILDLKNPKLPDDLIDARTISELRRQVRSASGSTHVSRYVADNLDYHLGSNIDELKGLNSEYAPWLKARNKAFRMFNPSGDFSTGGEKYIGEQGNMSSLGMMSATDKAFLKTLSEGSGRFSGIGKLPSGENLQNVIDRIAKLRRLQASNTGLKLLVGSQVGKVGLFKTRIAERIGGVIP